MERTYKFAIICSALTLEIWEGKQITHTHDPEWSNKHELPRLRTSEMTLNHLGSQEPYHKGAYKSVNINGNGFRAEASDQLHLPTHLA
jgi:hypothetical protein